MSELDSRDFDYTDEINEIINKKNENLTDKECQREYDEMLYGED